MTERDRAKEGIWSSSILGTSTFVGKIEFVVPKLDIYSIVVIN